MVLTCTHAFDGGDVAHIIGRRHLNGLVAFVEQQIVAEAAIWRDGHTVWLLIFKVTPAGACPSTVTLGLLIQAPSAGLVITTWGGAVTSSICAQGRGGVAGLIGSADFDLVGAFGQLLLGAEASLTIHRNGLGSCLSSQMLLLRVGEALNRQDAFAHARAILQVEQLQRQAAWYRRAAPHWRSWSASSRAR